MKFKLVFFLLSFPLIALADINDNSRPMDLSKLPQPDSGVKIVPVSKTSFTDKENKELARRQEEQKQKVMLR